MIQVQEFDLVVVGSGSGLDVASGLAARGRDVAVIEPGRLGGTCLNRGCIPSKMLIHRADIVQEIKNSEEFGINSRLEKVNFDDIISKVNSEVHGESDSIRESLEASENHTLFRQEASFVDEKVLELSESGERIRGEKILVAAGSRPYIPDIEGTEDCEFWTSREALNPGRKPESLIIVGGGYIALEMAHFYDAMGTDITILERGDLLLDREDREISEKITETASNRYDVHIDTSVTGIDDSGENKKVDAGGKTLQADEVMFATGRIPNSDRLDLKKAGVETTESGEIRTDGKMRTSVDDVYALGDVADGPMLKHTANHEAEIVFKNILSGDEYEADYSGVPHAIFTSPQVAGVGKTERELEDSGQKYLSATYDYADTGMGQALHEEDGFVKVLAGEDGEILGCHIVGPDASQLIHEALVAMQAGSGKVNDIKDTMHIHPALNEVMDRAFSQL